MSEWLDATLYPDREPPAELRSVADRVDFLVRLCGAWDFGALRRWHGLPALPYLGATLAYIRDDPSLAHV